METIERIRMNEEQMKEYFDYLVALRDSGATNMWGAAPYLEMQFGISRSEARKVLIAWIDSFSKMNTSS
jgi:hypothetical protein